MFKLISNYLDRLAMGVLTSGDRRVLVLDKEDNALLIRDGAYIPLFSPVMTDKQAGVGNATLGGLWLASLMHVISDKTGRSDMLSSLVVVATSCGMPASVIDIIVNNFEKPELKTGSVTLHSIESGTVLADKIVSNGNSPDDTVFVNNTPISEFKS